MCLGENSEEQQKLVREKHSQPSVFQDLWCQKDGTAHRIPSPQKAIN